jgi:hypothetical protein
MTDRKLLEAAAKAAGIYLEWDGPPDQWVPMYYQGKTYHIWNPLTEDGDALRLAVKLKMTVDVIDEVAGAGVIGLNWYSALYKDDPYAATRRVIVRAAAEIGRK